MQSEDVADRRGARHRGATYRENTLVALGELYVSNRIQVVELLISHSSSKLGRF